MSHCNTGGVSIPRKENSKPVFQKHDFVHRATVKPDITFWVGLYLTFHIFQRSDSDFFAALNQKLNINILPVCLWCVVDFFAVIALKRKEQVTAFYFILSILQLREIGVLQQLQGPKQPRANALILTQVLLTIINHIVFPIFSVLYSSHSKRPVPAMRFPLRGSVLPDMQSRPCGPL